MYAVTCSSKSSNLRIYCYCYSLAFTLTNQSQPRNNTNDNMSSRSAQVSPGVVKDGIATRYFSNCSISISIAIVNHSSRSFYLVVMKCVPFVNYTLYNKSTEARQLITNSVRFVHPLVAIVIHTRSD